MDKVFLICNAHLDPVWLWEWEEGAAEAISTFRIAADLCEEFDEFIFNHNEVILYRWVEEYEPALFKRIQQLVKRGKWHIMGGWYLQPDCNMPSGESFVRQALAGRLYFQEKFGVAPTTAINFDPFGHTQGLVQILQKSGYDSYIIGRPNTTVLPEDDFIWAGLDGSQVRVHRAPEAYNSGLGKAQTKVRDWMKRHKDQNLGIILWGIGNHGGGPSRLDLRQLRQLIRQTKDRQIIHSTPEAAFAAMRHQEKALPRLNRDLAPCMVGCYTSQVRIKQKHRQLENELFLTEKMLTAAALQGSMAYPKDPLGQATQDLLFSQFHDILPGSAIPAVEESAIRLMDQGLETLSRLKARAFFALSSGQAKAREGQIPILAYNPHPFPVRGVFECEFQPADQNWTDEFSFPVVHQAGKPIPCQAEKEASNINLDWRKRSVFFAELAPMQMNRFDVKLQTLPKKPAPKVKAKNGKFTVKTKVLEVVVNARTGLIDRYRTKAGSFLKPDSFRPLVIADNEDPWGMSVVSFRKVVGKFTAMTRAQAAEFAGVHRPSLDAVRVVEDGEARTVIEALLGYHHSFICQRYKIPKQGTQVEVEVRVLWTEKDKMLKLSIPTALTNADYLGQTAFGVQTLANNGNECVAQKWTAAVDHQSQLALTCINNGVYGSDFADGEMRLSLLRSPAYSAHPIPNRPIISDDRFLPRIDQGERLFSFWIDADRSLARLARVDREALALNEKPFILSFFPSGQGTKPLPALTLSDGVVQVSAFKMAERSDDLIIRLVEPTGKPRATTLSLPTLKIRHTVKLNGFEVKTFKVNRRSHTCREVKLMET